MFFQRLTYPLSCLAGGLLPFAFAPYSLAPIAILCLCVLLWIWRDCTPRKAAIAGYCFGLGYFGAGVYWVYFSIHHFAYAPLILAMIIMLGMVAILSCYPALLGYVLNRWVPERGALRYLLAFPFFWLLMEWFRSWLFTGFPWLSLGYSQIDTWLSGWAPVTGVLGLSWMVALTAGGLMFSSLAVALKQRSMALAVVVLLWCLGGGLSLISWTQPSGPKVSVALVQPNIPQEIKWLRSFQMQTLTIHERLTAKAGPVDVVVWPETAIPVFHHLVRDSYLPAWQRRMSAQGVDVITGIPVQPQPGGAYFNGLLSSADLDLFYFKHHLVPLGEYMPLKPLSTYILDWMQIPLSDFSAGKPGQPLLQAGGYAFASSICYEDVFPRASREGLPEAAYLVNISNDTWFGDTIAPAQHLQMARMRALESGRYMLRATNTGLTAVIDNHGQLQSRAPQFQRFVLTDSLVPMQGSTPYVLWGWWFNAAFMILSGALLMAFIGRPRKGSPA